MSEISLPSGVFAAATGRTSGAAPAVPAAPSPQSNLSPVASESVQEKPATAEKLPPAEEMPKGMTAAEKKIWKLKADGEEFEFDASDEETVKREIMKARGADKRFKEAAAAKQQAEQFFQMIKDPKKLVEVLQDPKIGHDFKKIATEYLWERMEEEKMTPEQKAQRERDRKLEALETQEKVRQEEQNAQKTRAFESHFEKVIVTALEAKGVPRTSETVSRMASYLEKATEKGYDLSSEELADLVKKDIAADYQAYISSLDEDQFVSFIGEHAEKLRKADLKKLRSPQGMPFPKGSSPKPKSGSSESKQQKVVGSKWKEDLQRDFLAGKWRS